MNLLEFVKVLCLKSVAIVQTDLCSADLFCCFERYELERTTAKALWHEDIALDEWSCDGTFSGKSRTRTAALQNFENTCYVNHVLLQ